MTIIRRLQIFGSLFAALYLLPATASAIDWSKVQGKEVVFFFPGQASFEWTMTEADHSGGPKFREGKKCSECHRGEERDIGKKIVTGQKVEPAPIAGKRGSIDALVKVANDGERLYIRIEWADAPPPSGPKMDPDFEAKVTMMIGDDSLVEAKRAGCWGTCHDDAQGMASAAGDAALSKYLSRSRTKLTRQGGGENYKSAADIDALLKDGKFMEIWQARLNKGAAAVPADGYILDKRHMNDSPLVAAEASFANGKWAVVLSRKLTVGQAGHKDIVAGQTYHVGFAIHDAHAKQRFHHVTLDSSLVLDQGSADFVAARQ